MSAISDRYAALGGPASFLGSPTNDETPTPDGMGAYRHYQFGSIYWSGATGAHEVHGLIHDKWAALGWENFGYPTTDESGTADGMGRFNHFTNLRTGVDSSIYWTKQTDAHEVHGRIREKWAALGWENFGYPKTDESGTPDGIGRFNHFHNLQTSGDSSIYWTLQTDAHEVHGAIRDKWASLGWEAGWLGYPIADEIQTADISWQSSRFQNGSILWSRTDWPTQAGTQPHRAGLPGVLVPVTFPPSPPPQTSQFWGLLANPGFEGTAMKSAYFFAGNWKFGDQIWCAFPSNANNGLYTLHPVDARHLGWSESQANRDFALGAMVDAGLNVIKMSYWGPPGTDRWAFWAPMNCSTCAHDEVFETALQHNLLITPTIESAGATNFNAATGRPYESGSGADLHEGNSPAYIFAEEFPGSAENPAPGLVAQIVDLIDRYLLHPGNPAWPTRWVQMYNRDGEKRHAVGIIQASSWQPGLSDESFATGLDWVADKVYSLRQVHVGFVLDPLPGPLYSLRPSAAPFLAATGSFLAMEPFISEIAMGTDDLRTLIPVKQQLVDAWVSSGVPFILDVSPGYDGHIVFPKADYSYWRIPNDVIWHNAQTQMIVTSAGTNAIRGVTFNTWNGFTEGYAAMATLEYGSQSYTWLQSLCQLIP